MLTKIYAGIWIVALVAALVLLLTGNMTMLAIVTFGFIAFGLVFMGMMGVLPATVVHAHTRPAEAKVAVASAKRNIRDRLKDYKETLSTEAIGIRRPKFP